MSDSVVPFRDATWTRRPTIIRALAAVARYAPEKVVVRVSAQISRHVRYPASVFPIQDRAGVLAAIIPQSTAYQNAVDYLETVLEGK